MMLDVARHFLPKDDVLRYLDLLAAHKLNVFHFHLTDDQGWRIEIKRFPRLTEVGSWRSRTKHGHRASELWDETPHGGYYTQDDIREIVAYAAERHIRVVPEIDIPGHSQAAIAAYPELGNADVVDTTALSVWDTWGINANVLAPTDNTLRFFEGVLEEVLDLFPAATSPFIHIGGDECRKDQWKESPVAQARIDEFGLANEDELQSWIIRHFDTWLTARGRRLIGWDEILEGGLPAGAAVSSWRGYGGGIAAAEAGHDVVMCPEQHVYLDHRQDGGPDEPMPIGFVRTLEDVYRFEPVPAGLSEEAARHILGTQANVWTEVMQNRARVDYQVFPRLAAFAEVAWSPLPASAERDFAAFERRMTTHYARLDALGVDYRPPAARCPVSSGPECWDDPSMGCPRTCDPDRTRPPAGPPEERAADGCPELALPERNAALGRQNRTITHEPCRRTAIHTLRRSRVKREHSPDQGWIRPSRTLASVRSEDVPELPRPGFEHVPYGETAGQPGHREGAAGLTTHAPQATQSVTLPASLDEAVAALGAMPAAVPVAGGTDLMAAVNKGLLRPRAWSASAGSASCAAGTTRTATPCSAPASPTHAWDGPTSRP